MNQRQKAPNIMDTRRFKQILDLDYTFTGLWLRPLILIGVIGHPLFYLVLKYLLGYHESPIGRSLVTALIAVTYLLTRLDRWNSLAKCYYETFLAIVFPMFFTYMALLNDLNSYWYGSLVFSGLAFGLLTKPIVLPIGYSLGAVAGTWLYQWLNPANPELVAFSLQAHLAAMLTAVIANALMLAVHMTFRQSAASQVAQARKQATAMTFKELLAARRQVNESRERMELALRGADMYMWDLDLDSGQLIIDPLAARLLDTSSATLPTNLAQLQQLMPASDYRHLKHAMLAYLKGETQLFESECRLQNGFAKPIWFLVRGQRVSTGPANRLSGIVQDITSRKAAEQKSELLEAQLQKSQRIEAIGALAGGIAHDFNNILHPIIGYAELMRDQAGPNRLLKEGLSEIITGAKRARGLIRQILTFSRQAEVELQPLYVQSILKEVVKLTRSSIGPQIELIEQIDPDCPAILADPTQLHQIVMNLVINAQQALEKTEQGKIELQLQAVICSAQGLEHAPGLMPGRYVCLTVADNGIGMSQATLDHIFEPYFSTKAKDKGTGLGLSVVHGIVNHYKGQITVSSKPNTGTVFKVFLPALGDSAEAMAPSPKAAALTGTERILFVDDEPMIVRMGRRTLESLGYHVTAVASSIEALKAFQQAPAQFDLVITDITMGGMDGLQLASRMNAIRPDIKIIGCSGFSGQINRDSARAYGLDDFILKPILKQELSERIRRVLESG